MDFSQIDFSRLSTLEMIGMIGGAVGLVGAGALIIRVWLNKLS